MSILETQECLPRYSLTNIFIYFWAMSLPKSTYFSLRLNIPYVHFNVNTKNFHQSAKLILILLMNGLKSGC